jgi:hypothetical protein
VTWEITYRRGDKGTCCGWGRVPCGSSVLDRAGTATAGAAGAVTLIGRAASGWKLQSLRGPTVADLAGDREIEDGRLRVKRRSMWSRKGFGKVGGRGRDEENLGRGPQLRAVTARVIEGVIGPFFSAYFPDSPRSYPPPAE